jgi:hypothetical protein
MICSYCGKNETDSHGVFCDSCWQSRLRELPMHRYVAALERFKKFIEGGGELKYYDDTTTGSKNSECTWGLCDQSPEMWPEKKDHTWPHSFETEGRSAPLLPPEGHGCPMDKREKKSRWGCFYHCRVFQGPKPDRQEAIQLYQVSLEKLCGK